VDPVSEPSLVFSALHLPRPLDPTTAARFIERLAAERDAPALVLELRADEAGVAHLLGCAATDLHGLRRLLANLLPGSTLSRLESPRIPVQVAGRLRVHPAGPALRTDNA
jgi:hypothetical protein